MNMTDATAVNILLSHVLSLDAPAATQPNDAADPDMAAINREALASAKALAAAIRLTEHASKALCAGLDPSDIRDAWPAARHPRHDDTRRLRDLETLIVGYRRRCIRLIALLRDRQGHDLKVRNDAVDLQRGAEMAEIARLSALEPWALYLLSGGQHYADAQPPADWASLRAVAQVMAIEVSDV